MYQQLIIVGNVGVNSPDMRYTPSGQAVASFSLAVNKSWVNSDGERQDKTLWFRVTCWRNLAETVSEYVTKGMQVLVVGEIEEARTWTDKDGNNRASLEMTAREVRFLGKRAEAAQEQAPAHVAGEDIPF